MRPAPRGFATFATLCHALPRFPYARLGLQVLVVANPANTNALILKENAPSIPPGAPPQQAARYARCARTAAWWLPARAARLLADASSASLVSPALPVRLSAAHSQPRSWR